MKINDVGDNRLVRILAGDKRQNPQKICSLLSSDLKVLLESYAELDGDVEVELLCEDGTFYLDIKAKANRMKSLGVLP